MSNERWSFDQALAWTVWRDDDSVRRVGPGGAMRYGTTSYRDLKRRRLFYDAPARVDAAGNPIDHRDAAGKPIGYSDAITAARFNGPPRIGREEDLYRACAAGKLKATGRFDGGRVETIDAAEWMNGRPSPKWSEITFDVQELHRMFPADGSSLAAEAEVEAGEDMQFDGGYLSPLFVTNFEKKSCELENPYILIHEKKLSALQPLLRVLEAAVRSGKPLFIIAEDIEGETLETLVVNKRRGGLKCAAVRTISVGERHKAFMENIATLTDGYLIDKDLGIKLENVTLDMLGRAKKVIVTKDKTIIIGGAGKKVASGTRVSEAAAGLPIPPNGGAAASPIGRDAEIRRRLEREQNPGRNIPWKTFNDDVRAACGASKSTRGFSDRSIERAVVRCRA